MTSIAPQSPYNVTLPARIAKNESARKGSTVRRGTCAVVDLPQIGLLWWFVVNRVLKHPACNLETAKDHDHNVGSLDSTG